MNYRLKLSALVWVIIQHTSATYGCPVSCKCHLKDVFCIGNGNILPSDIPWNKTIVHVRNYKIDNDTLNSETTNGNNVTRSLFLQQLGIKDVEDGAFELYQRVEILNLNENLLTRFRDDMFVGLERLKVLHVSKNQIKEIDVFFHYLETLFVIDFSYNNISSLKWIPEIKSKRLRFEQYSLLRTLYGASFHAMQPYTINLSNNPLSEATVLDENLFRTRTRLVLADVGLKSIPLIDMAVSYLDLSHNNIVAITSLDTVRMRVRIVNEGLSLNNNNLATIAPRAFLPLIRLETLRLENNALKNIPAYLPSSLRSLYLSNNAISAVHRFSFIRLSYLHHLSLKNNKIKIISQCSFCGLTRLQYLLLEGNCITTLPEEGLMGLDSLKTLTLSRNGIQRMASGCFIGLRSLKVLDLSFIRNEIDMDGDTFDPLGSMEELLLRGSPYLANAFLSSTRALATLKNLRRLDISHNKLISLINDISMFLPRLSSLDMSANRWQCYRDKDVITNLRNTHRDIFVRGTYCYFL